MPATPKRVLGASVVKPKTTIIACRKCHARKVKCSGGQPCSNCRRDSSEAECSYPNRARYLKVKESYMNDLLTEIDRLKHNNNDNTENGNLVEHESSTSAGIRSTPTRTAQESQTISVTSLRTQDAEGSERTVAFQNAVDTANQTPAVEEDARNPLLEDRPWFISFTPEMPVLVEEATDVAFATKFRQALSGKTQSHFPRIQYTPNSVSSSLTLASFSRPPPARARVLMKVALNTICQRYYLVRKSEALALLDRSIQSPVQCDAVSTCKLFSIFALGEVYLARASFPGAKFPGIDYYNNASHILRVLGEEPRVECVEVLAMLSLYSLTMNRRHAAYCMTGCAMRFAILMGLHHNVPHILLPDREHVEHRVRLWWTVYILDRMWATMLGQPVSIRDEDIEVALPSSHGIPDPFADDFRPADNEIAGLRMTRISAEVTSSVYGRNMQQDSFSLRVQQALKKLDVWVRSLPDGLRIKVDQASNDADMTDTMLQLYYNQCLILVTRPILLHVLRLRRANNREDVPVQPNEPTLALAEACVLCAKRSYRLLMDAWINGSFPTFDYTLTRYLFSTCIILAISSLSQAKWPNAESEDFEAGSQILDQLSENGSPGASEFMMHIKATRSLMEARVGQDQSLLRPSTVSNIGTASGFAGLADIGTDPAGHHSFEPSLQDLLSFSQFNLDTMETSFNNDDFQSFYWLDPNAEIGQANLASDNLWNIGTDQSNLDTSI